MPISSPLNANVWKLLAQEGDILEPETTIAILEAMKLEINVNTEKEMVGAKVEKLLVRPNDVVRVGEALVLIRRGE